MGCVVGDGAKLSVTESLSAFWRRMPTEDSSIVDRALGHRGTD